MHSSRVQLGLMAALVVGLGFSLLPSDAVGYPAGAAVSIGSNPVWSTGGDMSSGDHTVVTAVDSDLIITDVSLSSWRTQWWDLKLTLADGTQIASFAGEHLNTYPLHRTFSSGLRVPQGSSLKIVWAASHGGSNDYRYTLSGYYAQP